MTTMPTRLRSHTRRRRLRKLAAPTPMLRQWRLVELLSSDPEGITVAEAAGVFGVVLKTIRRDLILLRQLGFDLAEVKEDKGRKRWRIRAPFERLRTKCQKYRSLLGLLDMALEQTEAIGDERLAKDLGALRRRVARRCK